MQSPLFIDLMIEASFSMFQRLSASAWNADNSKEVPVGDSDPERVSSAYICALFQMLEKHDPQLRLVSQKFTIKGNGNSEDPVVSTFITARVDTHIIDWSVYPYVEVPMEVTPQDLADLDKAMGSITTEQIRALFEPIRNGWTVASTDGEHKRLFKKDESTLDSSLLIDFIMIFARSMSECNERCITKYKSSGNCDDPGIYFILVPNEDMEGFELVEDFARQVGLRLPTPP